MADDNNAKVRGLFSSELHGSKFALLSLVRKARALRGEFFPPRLFADPAWDILLDLYEARLAQFRLSISKVGQGTGLPATTVLRWLKALEENGLIRREEDPADGRRVYVELTWNGYEKMDRLFAAIEHCTR